MTLRNLTNYRSGLLAGLCLVMGLASCQTANEEYCETTEDCNGSELCTGNVCITTNAADAGSFEAEPDSNTSAPDATPTDAVCPTDTHQCLPSAPEGWTGPSIRADGLFGATQPVCPDGFETLTTGFHELIAGGSCGCSCGAPSDVTCSDPAIEGRDGDIDLSVCFATCTGDYCTRQELTTQNCTTISPAVEARDNLRWEPSLVTGGQCDSGTISNDLEEPSFVAQTSLCTLAQDQGGCSEDNACAPKAPQEFGGQTCIFQEGVHECPADSIYSERLITFASYDDQRSCDTCDCTLKANGDCGTLEFFNDDGDCSGTPFEQGVCTAMPILTTATVKFARNPQASCSATPNPTASGEVVGVGATTLCCTAP